MTDFVAIRGYAIPFNRTIYIEEVGVELIDRNAFRDMLRARRRYPVAIRWFDHDVDAYQIAGSAQLFDDGHGLGFSCTVDMRAPYHGGRSSNWAVIASMTRSVNPVDQCSVGDFMIDEAVSDTVGGIACRRVLKATISHITITDHAAYRQYTGVWPSHCDLDRAPYRIQEMSARWEIGKQLHALRSKRDGLISAAETIVNGKGLGPGGDLSPDQMTAFWAKVAAVKQVDQELGRLGEGVTHD